MCLRGLHIWTKCCLILQVISVVAAQGVMTFAPKTNLALKRPVSASSTCGSNGIAEEFCAYGAQCGEKVDVCNTTCGDSGKLPSYIDVLAVGEFQGKVSPVTPLSSCSRCTYDSSFQECHNVAGISFNCTFGGYVRVPKAVLHHTGRDITITAWVQQQSGNKGFLFAKVSNNTRLRFALVSDAAAQRLTFQYQRGASEPVASVTASNVTLSDGRCHHVALLLATPSTVRVYTDGVLVLSEDLGSGQWNESGVLFFLGSSLSHTGCFQGILHMPRVYPYSLYPHEMAYLAGKSAHAPNAAPQCRCPPKYPDISSIDERYCLDTASNISVTRLNLKSHFSGFATDGNDDTWWQSRNGDLPANLTINLLGIYQVLNVLVTFRSKLPKAAILMKSTDNGRTWSPLQYYAYDCVQVFNMENLGKINSSVSVICDNRFSDPMVNRTLKYDLFENKRTTVGEFLVDKALQEFTLSSHLRLALLASHGNASERSAFFAVSEIVVRGRGCSCKDDRNISSCFCNGSFGNGSCNNTVEFSLPLYERSIVHDTPVGSDILQVHARTTCDRSLSIYYSIRNASQSDVFNIHNTSGILRLTYVLQENATYHVTIQARVAANGRSVVAFTYVIINSIKLADFNLRTKVDFKVTKLGFLKEPTSRLNERDFGLFVNGHPGTQGEIIATVGRITTLASYNREAEPAIYVSAVVARRQVWYEDPVLRVVAHVRDGAFGARTDPEKSKIVVRVRGSENLPLTSGGSRTIQVVKSPSSEDGLCRVDIQLPSVWLTFLNPSNEANLTVAYRLQDSSNPMQSLGIVSLHPGPSKTQLHQPNDVYAILPSRTVYIGSKFRFGVYADSSYALATFTVKLMTDPCLEIIGCNVADDTWLSVGVNESATMFAVSGVRSNPQKVHAGVVKGEKLITFEIYVNETAMEGDNSTLRVEVIHLSTINNEEIRLGRQPLPAFAAIIEGSEVSRHTTGKIHIQRNFIRELISYVEPSEIVNTAVINGEKVSASIRLLGVRVSGEMVTIPFANCSSLSPAVRVHKNCSEVYVNGTETAGSEQALILIQFFDLTVNVSVRVWFPMIPLTLTVKQKELGAVIGWLIRDPKDSLCAQKYEWTSVSAQAQFLLGGKERVNISVTNLVRGTLRSLNDSVAYTTRDGLVIGRSEGRADIFAVNPVSGNTVGNVDIHVNRNKRVSPLTLDVVMVTNISLSIPPSPYQKMSSQTAQTSLGQNMLLDNARASVIAYAVFNDSSRTLLLRDMGLKLNSANEHVLQIFNNSEAISVGSGIGVIRADWLLPVNGCYPAGYSLVTGYSVLNVRLSPPIALEITGVSPQVTFPGDTSIEAGYPTFSPINIVLVFDDNHRVDMATDSRTIFDLSGSKDLFYIRRDKDNRPLIVASKPGKSKLIVRFSHFSITKEQEINIVSYVGLSLQAKPYPHYPGSNTTLINRLKKINGTAYYQMASLCLRMVMSDASLFEITKHDLTTFSSVDSSVLEVGRKGPNIVEVVKDFTQLKFVYVKGKFGSLTPTDMIITIDPSAVTVTSLQNLRISSDTKMTLSSVKDSEAAKVQLSLTFSDSKQIPQFYSASGAVFLGLVTLTSEHPSVFSVDSNSGAVTLRRNHHTRLLLTATVAGSSASSKVELSCNLKPSEGDIDLGEEVGVPLPTRKVRESYDVPVRLNAGITGVNKMDLDLIYDQTYIQAVSATAGNRWKTFFANLNTPGKVIINVLSDTTLVGTVYVANIRFNSSSPGICHMLGTVTTQGTTRNIVAGNLNQVVVGRSERSKRSIVTSAFNFESVIEEQHHRMRRSSPCFSPPCDCAGDTNPGDVNRDCLFDISDVMFVLNYVTHSCLNFTQPVGQKLLQSLRANHSSEMDVDKNTVINPTDAYYLLRVNLDLIRFVTSVTVVPVQDLNSGCELVMNITLRDKSTAADPYNTFVYFDMTYAAQKPVNFAGSSGTFRTSGFYGNVIKAKSKEGGVFEVQGPINFVQDGIGLTVFHLTIDSLNQTTRVRSAAMFGSPRPPYRYLFPLKVNLPESGIEIDASQGYNPYLSFNNKLGSSDCVNEFAPVFQQNIYYANVSENATVNSIVVKVNATDLDPGKNGEITYNITSVAVPFYVDSVTGVVRTRGLLDRETQSIYNVSIRATDGGSFGRERFAQAHVVIVITDINDNTPGIRKIKPSRVIKIPENTAVGNAIAWVFASDPDEGSSGEVVYTTETYTQLFLMNSSTGEIKLNDSLHGQVGETFEIAVVLKDQGIPPLSRNITVVVKVSYAWDVDVVFNENFYVAEITETSPSNTSFIKVRAYVPGLPLARLRYSLLDNQTFTIGESDGVVRTRTVIDRELTAFFNLFVFASYGPNITSNVTLNVTVLDINDNAPVVAPVPLQTIPCTIPKGSTLLRVNASDADIGVNGVIRFGITGQYKDLFGIGNENGTLFVASSLLKLNVSLVEVMVVVSDSAFAPLFTNITVNVSVLFPPRFRRITFKTNLLENTTTGQVLFTFHPIPRPGQSTFYNIISGNIEDIFLIRNVSGEVVLNETLDRETNSFYSLNVLSTNEATQRYKNILPIKLTLNISVEDVNDNAPDVSHIPALTLNNTVITDTVVIVVNASDYDVGLNGQLTFQIIDGNQLGRFTVDKIGRVQVNQSLFNDNVLFYSLKIKVSDLGFPSLFTIATVNITIVDGRGAPMFNQSSYNTSIAENAAVGSYISLVRAADNDGEVLSYNITSGSPSPSHFTINSSSGVISTQEKLDREVVPIYLLRVTAYKYSPLTRQVFANTVKVFVIVTDVNDNAPVVNNIPLQIVPYSLPQGSVVFRVNATDADVGNNTRLTFELARNPGNLFDVNSTGEVVVASQLTQLNDSRLQILITVSDHGHPVLASNISVNISVLFPPRFAQLMNNVSVLENASIGQHIFTFNSVVIPGLDPTVMYKIVSGNQEERYKVCNNTGLIVVNGSLDREAQSFYLLTISASNEAVWRFTDQVPPIYIALSIRILDVNDNTPSVPPHLQLTVLNTVPVGSLLGDINATDSDIGTSSMLKYEVIHSNTKSPFSIDADGIIRTNKSLLFDSVIQYSLTVRVSDMGVPSLSSLVIVNVTVVDGRSSPSFNQSQYNGLISENAEVGTGVLLVHATDPDGDAFYYVILLPEITAFKLNASTGQIYTSSILDRETVSMYSFRVMVYKTSPLTQQVYNSTAQVDIMVTDFNDVAPDFGKKEIVVNIKENTAVGSSIVTVLANDSDTGMNAFIAYSIVAGNMTLFAINNSSGEITVRVLLDYEKDPHQFNITIQAQDSGALPLSSNLSIIVNIWDTNDNTPIITPEYNTSLREDVSIGTFVLQVSAVDADRGTNAALSFFIVQGNGSEFFAMNSSTGVLTTAHNLDYEKTQIYHLNVTVRDHGNPPRWSSRLVTIKLTDINDITPIIEYLRPVRVRESVPVGTLVAQVKAIDGDSGINAVLNFSIIDGNQAGKFKINISSGIITTERALDHENATQYNLNIGVTDNGQPPRSSTALVTVVVVDVNDHRPVFTEEWYRATIYENTAVNTLVAQVEARDLDNSGSTAIFYNLVNGNYNGTFWINSSGDITLRKAVDYEQKKMYNLTVKATDTFPMQTDSNDSVQFSSYANVTIFILDSNDNLPQFSRSEYSFVIKENLIVGAHVLTVSATDQDSGSNAEVMFQSAGGNEGYELFSLNRSTGEITVKSPLTEANFLQIKLLVNVSDEGEPSLTGPAATVLITISFNVTLNNNNTNPFKFSFNNVLPQTSPTMIRRDKAVGNLELFSSRSGFVQAEVVNVSDTVYFNVAREPAIEIKASLLNEPKEVWPEFRQAVVVVQVFDQWSSTLTSTRGVLMVVRNLNDSAQAQLVSKCQLSRDDGTCISKQEIPLSWFNETEVAFRVALYYGFTMAKLEILDHIVLRKQSLPKVENNVLVVLPSHVLHSKEIFNVKVYVRFTELVSSFILLFKITSGLGYNIVVPSSYWAVQSSSNGAEEFAVLGIRKENGKAEIDPDEVIVTVTLEVKDVHHLVEEVSCVVKSLSAVGGDVLIPNSEFQELPGVIYGRGGQAQTGKIHVDYDNIKSLLFSPEETVLVNTAVLTGIHVKVSLNVKGVTALGTITNVSGLWCFSSNSNVLKVYTNCTSVYLNGSESLGGAGVVVHAAYRNVTVTLSFTVWLPVTPLSLIASQTLLKQVKDWRDPDNSCRSRYQHARLRATADFTNGLDTKPNADVTHLIEPFIRSSNTSVIAVKDGVAYGRHRGLATLDIYVRELGKSIGAVTMNVSDKFQVRVYILDVLTVARMSVSFPTVVNRTQSYAFHAEFEETITFERDPAEIVLTCQYSDGQVNTFNSLNGFYINTTNSSVATAQGGKMIALNSGEAFVDLWMQPGRCNEHILKHGRGRVHVAFAKPHEVRVSMSKWHITPPGDTAEAVNLPTHVQLNVFLDYNTSGTIRSVDMSADNRTIYDVNSGSGLIVLEKHNKVVVRPSGHSLGNSRILVRFKHVELEKEVELQVVGAKTLNMSAIPYPSFNGSENTLVTKLLRIGESGEYRQVQLRFQLVLSNGSALDLSRDSRVSVTLGPSTPSSLRRSTCIERRNEVVVLSVRPGAMVGSLLLSGGFGVLHTAVPLLLQIDSLKVTVNSVKMNGPPQLTLRGVRNLVTMELTANVRLSDNTTIPQIPLNLTLTNIVTFSSSRPDVLSVNSSTGLATLRNNSPTLVTVTVSSADSAANHSIAIACNLDPDVGDIDLGDPTGSPIKSTKTGALVKVTVRLNSRKKAVGSFDFEVKYDAVYLTVMKVSKGEDMGGLFFTNILSDSGSVHIAGVLALENVKGEAIHIADIEFRTRESGIAQLGGVISMIASDDLEGSIIGFSAFPRPIIAGNLTFVIDGSVRSRRSVGRSYTRGASASLHRSRRQVVNVCQKTPCTVCPAGRQLGDTDGNCLFDVRDVKYLMTYLLEKQFNFSRSKGQQIKNSIQPEQLKAMDANGDGVISISDALHLMKATTDAVSLSPSLRVIPVESPLSHCRLTIAVAASEIRIQGSYIQRSQVFFDISHSSARFVNDLQMSSVHRGSLVTKHNEPNLYGALYKALYNNQSNSFEISLNTSLVYSNIGLSVVQVTTASDGSVLYSRSAVIVGQYADPPTYQVKLNTTLPLGNNKEFYLRRPNGYNPLRTFNNSLASVNCSDRPLLEENLTDIRPLDARSIFVEWKLRNVRKELNFTFSLRLQECELLQVNTPCQFRLLQVAGYSHVISRLKPYTVYRIQVTSIGGPMQVSTRWASVRTFEAAPEGVKTPALILNSDSSVNVSWSAPEKPNGVLTSYHLMLSNGSAYSVVYKGLGYSYHVTNLNVGQTYYFYVVASTSAGGTKSKMATVTIPGTHSTAASTVPIKVLPHEVIIGIVCASVLLLILIIVIVVLVVRRRQQKKRPKGGPYSSLTNQREAINGYDNFSMTTRTSLTLRKADHTRGDVYETPKITVEGLENHWLWNSNTAFIDDNPQDLPLRTADQSYYQKPSLESVDVTSGYDESTMREALSELKDLEASAKTYADRQRSSIREPSIRRQDDNLVRLTSDGSGEIQGGQVTDKDTSKRRSKKKNGKMVETAGTTRAPATQADVEWDYYYNEAQTGSPPNASEAVVMNTSTAGRVRQARIIAKQMLMMIGKGEVSKEFGVLATERHEGSFLCANHPVNLNKNRYKNVLPYDHSRVMLLDAGAGHEQDQGQGQDGDGYINANYVDSYSQNKAFITTQGPMDGTIQEFWQMIWEQNVQVIVVLTRLQEGNKVKCVKYWPDLEEEVKFGSFNITLVNKQKTDSRVIRRLVLENESTGECREVTQLQFINWPDFGVPSSPIDFLQFYYEVASEERVACLRCPGVPTLVHCSAGIGRTGAFCTVRNALQSFTAQGEVDIALIVRRLRGQRYGMVQTLEQYVFCYRCIALALLYFFKLRNLKGISLSSISSSSENDTVDGGPSSPPEGLRSLDSKFNQFGNQTNQFSNQSNQLDNVYSRNAPPYSYSRTTVMPPFDTVHEEECVMDEKPLPVVLVHPTPDTPQNVKVVHPTPDTPQNSLSHDTDSKGRKKNAANRKKRLSQLGEPPPPPPPPPSDDLFYVQPSPPPPFPPPSLIAPPSPPTRPPSSGAVLPEPDYMTQLPQVNLPRCPSVEGFENLVANESSVPDLFALTSLDRVLAGEEELFPPPDEFAFPLSLPAQASNIESHA